MLKRSYVQLAILFMCICLTDASHYRGGIVTWRALNTTPSGSTAQVLIKQRHSWRRTFFSPYCDDSRISSGQLVGSGTGSLLCYVGNCGAYTSISANVKCTDFSNDTTLDYSSGERFDTRTLNLGQTYVLGYYGNAWMGLAIGGNGIWQVTGKIELSTRPDGILNTSPVTTTLPVIYKTINIWHVHIIQMSDADGTDTLRCRWSTRIASSNTNGYDECGSVCNPSLPSGYQLLGDNCTLVFKLPTANYYGVSIQIEDFYTSSSLTPMSSVPIQFLFLGRTAPSGCSTPPTITGVRPNIACIGTPIGVLTNETVVAEIGCTGKTIKEFVTTSPIGLRKSAIMNPSPGVFMITLTWIPTADQYGPQGFCAGAVDNTGVQSTPWCITFLVGFTAPNLQKPILVQGSASPLGTIFSNHSIFSIQSVNGVGVNRPGRNSTYIRFIDATANGSVAVEYDCGYSRNVTYTGSTIIVNTYPHVWTFGHQYYVTFDSGASSGVDFCRAESEALTDPTFWRFDIWNPGLSSTTSTTTTPPTTVTVTTRGVSTTTPAANLTTTGIVITVGTIPTTTSVTTTSTSGPSTVTSATTVTTATTVGEVVVISPEDYITACKQTVATMTAATFGLMLPVNLIGMFMMFTKAEKMFNPARINAAQRAKAFAKMSR